MQGTLPVNKKVKKITKKLEQANEKAYNYIINSTNKKNGGMLYESLYLC